MVKYINAELNYNSDTYDVLDKLYYDKFGEPSTEVYTTAEFIDFMQDVLAFSPKELNSAEIFATAQPDKKDATVSKVIATDLFLNAIEKLWKRNQKKVIEEVYNTVIKLIKYEITKGKGNHPLHNAKGHKDIHIAGGRLILLYRYLTNTDLVVDLKLQDLVDHKQLARYDMHKYDRSTKDFDPEQLNINNKNARQ